MVSKGYIFWQNILSSKKHDNPRYVAAMPQNIRKIKETDLEFSSDHREAYIFDQATFEQLRKQGPFNQYDYLVWEVPQSVFLYQEVDEYIHKQVQGL